MVSTFDTLRRRASLWGTALLLLGTLWVVRYWYSGRFGLYEDDLTIIPSAVQMSVHDLLRFVLDYLAHLRGHAGPIDESLIRILANLGWRLGGLHGIYWIGFAIEAFNVLLFYGLLRRLYSNTGFALIGALAYTLFSADTTQAFLTHSLGLQPSLTLLLLALHGWVSGRRVLAYLLAFAILFAYESPFPVFLAAPLLEPVWDARLLRRAWRHAVVVGLMLGAAAAVKALAGEERVTGLSVADALLTPLNHMVVGPAASLATFALRPIEVAYNLRIDVAALALIATAVFGWALTRRDMGVSSDWFDGKAWIRARIRWLRRLRPGALAAEADVMPLSLRLAVAGLAMWVLAYPLTFTTFGYHIRGRPTRVHLAAVVGSSLVVASVGAAVVQAASSLAGRRRRMIGLAAWLGLMAAYGLVLQGDYAHAWELEKDFWSRILPLVQDAREGTVILVAPTGVEDSYQIAANTWNLPRVLEQLYTLPVDRTSPPRVFRLADNWADSILDDQGNFVLDETTIVGPPSLYGSVPLADVILVETKDVPWGRRVGALALGSHHVVLPPVGSPALDAYPHSLLYDLLLGPSPTPPVVGPSLSRESLGAGRLSRQPWKATEAFR